MHKKANGMKSNLLKKAAAVALASMVCVTAVPAAAPVIALAGTSATTASASTTSVAKDGTYKATLKTYKYKKGKLDDTYSGTLRVTVKNGKISALSYSGDKDDKIRASIKSVSSSYIGKTASVAVISGADAVSSASLSTDGTAARSSSKKKYYVMDLKNAIIAALKKAPAASGSSSSGGSSSGSTTTATAVADGTYKGSASKTSSSEGTLTITLNVTVSGGKITGLSIVSNETTGNWASLVSTVSSEVTGQTAAASVVDTVSSATAQGWKAAIQTAIKNALNGQKTSGSGSSSSGSITTEKAVSDGTYRATLKTYKYKKGKLDDTYSGTLRVTVKNGKISALSYSGDKDDKIRSSIKSVSSSYIGKTASVSAINSIDAVSSASLSTDGSATRSTSKKYYVMDLKSAIVKALQSARS